MNKIDDAEAMLAYRKTARIQHLERRIQQLWYAPATAAAGLVGYYVLLTLTGRTQPQLIDFLYTGILLVGMGVALVKRGDDLAELFELKYGERHK